MCDAASMRFRIASIDLGTVSSRLLLATVEDGVIVDSNKHTVITNLGEGVDATGSLCDAAIKRVTSVCREFCRKVDAFEPDAVCTTLTSASARCQERGRAYRCFAGTGALSAGYSR